MTFHITWRCLLFISLPFTFLLHLSLPKREKGKSHTCPQLPLCHLGVNDAIGVDCQAILCCSHARGCLDSLLNSQVISSHFPKGLWFAMPPGPDTLLQNPCFPHALLSSSSPESQLYSAHPCQACLSAEDQPGERGAKPRGPSTVSPWHSGQASEATDMVKSLSCWAPTSLLP